MSDGFVKFLKKLGFDVEVETVDENGVVRTENEPGYEIEDRPAREPRGGLFGGGRKADPEPETPPRTGLPSTGVPGRGDIYVVEAAQRADAKTICDELRKGMTVVVNVEGLDESETTRLFDFVQGSVYALDGQIQQIQQNVIVVAPRGIEIQPDSAVSEARSTEDYSYIEDDDELDYGYR
ncbi:MAG: cell division protein SepF [Eubacteriaceae bacterium]|nr:cell division protein SepF [Eubacteriaceae bacterium]